MKDLIDRKWMAESLDKGELLRALFNIYAAFGYDPARWETRTAILRLDRLGTPHLILVSKDYSLR